VTVNTAVATVQSNGVRGVAVGTTELICRLGFGTRAEDRIPVTVTGSPTLAVQSGNNQTGAPGATLANSISVIARDANGQPVQGVSVQFTPFAANGSTNPTSATTNSSGIASTLWTLGQSAGTQRMLATATINNVQVQVEINANAVAGSTGNVTVTVRSAGGSPLSGVSVSIRAGTAQAGTALQSGTTNSSGMFTFSGLTPGLHTIQSSASGFTTDFTSTTVVAGQTQTVNVTLLASASTGGVSGNVKSSAGANIANATVEIRTGSLTTGTPLATATTNASGGFTFSGLAAGQYTLRTVATGFVTRTDPVTVVANQVASISIALVASSGGSTVQIILTWNTTDDLDAHLMNGPNTNPFVFYGQEGDCQIACLRFDVVGGFGPETIDIATPQAVTRYFHVHNYTACTGSSTRLATSGAKVEVYINGILTNTFNVPNQNGVNWGVFQINGTTITPANLMFTTPMDYVVCTPMAGTGSNLQRVSGEAGPDPIASVALKRFWKRASR
jgi:hypothetical protein